MDIFKKRGAQLTSSGHGSLKFIGRGLIASEWPTAPPFPPVPRTRDGEGMGNV